MRYGRGRGLASRSSPQRDRFTRATASPRGSAPEVRPVEPDGLADELTDGALAGGSGDGSSRVSSAASRSAMRARTLLRQRCEQAGSAARSTSSPRWIIQRARSRSPMSLEMPRTSTAGTPASSQARSTPKPSIASTLKPCSVGPLRTVALVAIGNRDASGNAARSAASRRGVGLDAVDDGDPGGEVEVRGFGAEDERARGDASAAGDAQVQHGVAGGRPARARASRPLPRPARSRSEAVVAAELSLGRGDEEDPLRSITWRSYVGLVRRALVRRDEPEHRVPRSLGEPLVVR